jgi:hypothetical protein
MILKFCVLLAENPEGPEQSELDLEKLKALDLNEPDQGR